MVRSHRVGLVVALTALSLCETYRLSDLEASLAEEPSDAKCSSGMSNVVDKLTYRDLFSTVMDGTYTIRNRNSNKLLVADENGDLGLSLSAEHERRSHWYLKKLHTNGVMPTYSMKQSRLGKFFSIVENKGAESLALSRKDLTKWSFRMMDDGIHYQIHRTGDEQVLKASGNMVGFASPDSGDSSGNFDDEWFLECSARSVYWSFLVTRSLRRSHQWNYVQTLPMLSDGKFTWARYCSQFAMDCNTMYSNSRQSYAENEWISEDNRNAVKELKIESVCSMSLLGLKGLTRHPGLLSEISKSQDGAGCSTDNEKLSRHLRVAVVSKCFSECLKVMAKHAEGESCSLTKFNSSSFFSKVLEADSEDADACAAVPSDTLEGLAEHTMLVHCQRIPPPELLWVYEDKAPSQTSALTTAPACTAVENRVASSGVCPSGTACDCPSTWFSKHLTTTEIRNKGQKGVSSNVFVKEGTAGVPSFLARRPRSILISIGMELMKRLLGGEKTPLGRLLGGEKVPLGQVVVNSLTSTTFLGQLAFESFSTVMRGLSHSCSNSVGCWPLWPQRTWTKAGFTACRGSGHAKKGGSRLFMLPPPGMRFHMSGLFRKCRLEACSQMDLASTRMGFGVKGQKDEGNVYNCQYLNYEKMDKTSRLVLLNEVRKNTPEEYKEFIQQAWEEIELTRSVEEKRGFP